jgi:hypothetical protein
MLSPKDFLLEELSNIDRCLREALRHDYGTENAVAFYMECTSRREALLDSATRTPDTDIASIAELAYQADNLSSLIGRIERSHRGEFSWSFAEEIDRLGKATCSAPTVDPSPPLFFFFSEGGSSSYAVHSEQGLAVAAKARIFNVVFPRTLKNHVLLHAILGHELGHAAASVPTINAKANKVIETLRENSHLLDAAKLEAWLSSIWKSGASVADEVPDYWLEELYCDLFGLVLFGPAFVWAHGTLLLGVDPTGKLPGDRHPPVRTRLRLIKIAVEELGWRSEIDSIVNSIGDQPTNVWETLDQSNLDEPWVKLLDDDQIRKAIRELVGYNAEFGSVFYVPCETEVTKELIKQALNNIPPTRLQSYDEQDFQLQHVDFRSILLAGWISWWVIAHKTPPNSQSFYNINRLCEQAILQQHAIRIQSGG